MEKNPLLNSNVSVAENLDESDKVNTPPGGNKQKKKKSSPGMIFNLQ